MITVTISRVDFGHRIGRGRSMRSAFDAALNAAEPAFKSGYFTLLDELFVSARKMVAFHPNCPRACAGDNRKQFHVEIARGEG